MVIICYTHTFFFFLFFGLIKDAKSILKDVLGMELGNHYVVTIKLSDTTHLTACMRPGQNLV